MNNAKINKSIDIYSLIILVLLIAGLITLFMLRLNKHQKPLIKNSSIPSSSTLAVKSSSNHQNLTNSQPVNPAIKGEKTSLTVSNNYNPIKIDSEPLQSNTNQLSQGSSNLQSGPNYNNLSIASQIY